MQRTRFSIKILILAFCLLLPWQSALGVEITPELHQSWARSFGGDYNNAPSPPLLDGDVLYTFVGQRLVRMDRHTGEILAQSPQKTDNGAGYAIIAPTMGGGMIFVPLRRGSVAAFDRESLELLWQTEPIGGQCLTKVTYADGKIFYGTWVTEEREGYYCGFSVDKAGCRELWRLGHKGGFYCAGSLYRDGQLIFGSDDGSVEGQSGNSVLYTVDAETGEVISEIPAEGDIRSDVAEYGGALVFSTKAGYVYKIDGEVERVKVGTACASTPTIDRGLAYVGTMDRKVAVADLETMSVVRQIYAPGYPKGGVVIRGDRLYTTCNVLPGGIYSCRLDDEELSLLFAPEEEEYCISPVVITDDAEIYYKNDSGNIFALQVEMNVTFESDGEELWLIRPDGPTIEKITPERGENTVKINGGGRAFLWRLTLEPLTEEIYL